MIVNKYAGLETGINGSSLLLVSPPATRSDPRTTLLSFHLPGEITMHCFFQLICVTGLGIGANVIIYCVSSYALINRETDLPMG